MKRYLSVFEMIIRCSIYKVFGILGIMIALEAGLLAFAWNKPIATMQPSLEEWIERSWICIPFLFAYWGVTKVLSSSGTNVGSMQAYTLQRLRIAEKRVNLLQCIYNIFCYTLLWMTQVLIFFVASGVYMKYKTGAILTNQTIFLAFYRNTFMHSILPMEDIFGWSTLVFFICMTGILATRFSQRQRHGKVEWSLILFLALAVIVFQRKLGAEPILLLMQMTGWVLYLVLVGLLNKGVLRDEREE